MLRHPHHIDLGRARRAAALVLALVVADPVAGASAARATAFPLRVAVIGDYGKAGEPARDVARLVHGWRPDLVVTTGDNNYERGEASTIDANVGQYWSAFIAPYRGRYGPGGAENRFFPALGNHDWKTGSIAPHLAYFSLPGNERYYDVRRGTLHLFIVDSDRHEPDGVSADSVQGRWLARAMAASDACWKLVVFHHPPYSSGRRGQAEWMRWPFRTWGADAVLSGHDHFYERLEVDGLPYFVNGAGGNRLYEIADPVPGSIVRFNEDYGAMLVRIQPRSATFVFESRARGIVDTFKITKACRSRR